MARTELSAGTSSDVVRWRCEQLRVNGFPSVLAEETAADERFDLHALIELTEQGCPPALAVRILAPLEMER
jgi:hypothetical protein